MGVFRIVHPGVNKSYKQFSEEIGGKYTTSGFLSGYPEVRVKSGEWTIVFDVTFTNPSCTRVRSSFLIKDGFQFAIYRKGLFSGLGELFGMRDIEVGYPEFDRNFIIKGNDEAKVRTLFANTEIRRLIDIQPYVYLKVRDDEEFLGAAPDKVDVLYFRSIGVIRDVHRLKKLYELFGEVLNQLCLMGSASEGDPGFAIGGYITWL
ncbi:MAG: DUF3137 domain-containing protein [Planctomycetes bacterium]|nr:DUF3137 domain-containing protein [Planctomycetota bacterium]